MFGRLISRLRGAGHGAILVRGAAGAFGLRVSGLLLGVVTQIILTRTLGIDDYGIYIYALTWVNVLSQLAQCGFATTLVRYVAAYSAQSDWSRLRGLLRRSLQVVLGVATAVAAIAAVVVVAVHDDPWQGRGGVFLVALVLLPILAVAGVPQAALRALKRPVASLLPDTVVRPLLLLAGLAVWLLVATPLRAVDAMVVNIAAGALALTLAFVWTRLALPTQVTRTAPRYETREWMRVSFPLLLMAGMRLLLNQTDVLMLGALQSVSDAGVYAVASRLADFVVFGLTAVSTIAAPMISELYWTGRRAELQRVVALAARGIFAFTTVAAGLLALFGELALGVFGDDFRVGYTPLLLLLAGQVVNGLAGPVGFLLTMTGHQNQAALVLGGTAVMNVALNAVLIPLYGTSGAALATSISMIAWNVGLFVLVRRKLQINPTVLAPLRGRAPVG